MADLRGLMGALGFADVTTYLQSGNVVFTGAGSARAAAATIEQGLESDLGLTVPALVRSAAELTAVLGATPYGMFTKDPKLVHVTFLSEEPDPAAVASLEDRAGEFGADRCQVIGTEVHLYCPGGYGETKLNNGYLERRLGSTATTRNWKTVTALAELARGGATAG
jgi:uncharacterized protein (DUF1697 family)